MQFYAMPRAYCATALFFSGERVFRYLRLVVLKRAPRDSQSRETEMEIIAKKEITPRDRKNILFLEMTMGVLLPSSI